MKRSSRGLSSRLRASTLSGNWTIDCHSRLRKLGKSVLSVGSAANFSCSRKRTPTSPLSMTSQPGSALVPSSRYSSSSPSSRSCFSVTKAQERFHHRPSLLLQPSSGNQQLLPAFPATISSCSWKTLQNSLLSIPLAWLLWQQKETLSSDAITALVGCLK